MDEEAQMEFYGARVPERLSSVSAFEHWRSRAERENPRVLYMTRADVMQRDPTEVSADSFPDDLLVGSNRVHVGVQI